MKDNIYEFETNSKIKNIRDLHRGIIDFKKGYQPRTNTVKNEKGDVVADCHSILARNYFSQLLNVYGVNDVRNAAKHTAEPLVPEHLCIVDVLAVIPNRWLSSQCRSTILCAGLFPYHKPLWCVAQLTRRRRNVPSIVLKDSIRTAQ
jgi:hypothetical protein